MMEGVTETIHLRWKCWPNPCILSLENLSNTLRFKGLVVYTKEKGCRTVYNPTGNSPTSLHKRFAEMLLRTKECKLVSFDYGRVDIELTDGLEDFDEFASLFEEYIRRYLSPLTVFIEGP